MSCGISPAFAGLSPIEGQVAHVLLTRAPCAHFLYCYRKLRTRLACVKHAASVRSEPGSNSRLKLAAWKTKSPTTISGCRTPVFQANFLCSTRSHSINRTGSGTSHLTQFVKEQRPPVQPENQNPGSWPGRELQNELLMCRLVHSKTKRVLARLIQLSKSRLLSGRQAIVQSQILACSRGLSSTHAVEIF